MEPVTHILTGACLARAGLNRRAAYATLTMAVAAEMPDLDTLWSVAGPVAGFQHHRGLTHSLIGLPVEAALVTAGVYGLHRWRDLRRRQVHRASTSQGPPTQKPLTQAPVRWGLLYGFALLALASHLLLDFTNNYGLRPFAPFNPRWYAGSFVFIFDPAIFLLLLVALVLPPLFSLVGAEVGARRQPFRGRGWAIASLLLIGGLWLLRAVEHARAEQIGYAQSVAAPQDPAAPDAQPVYLEPVRVAANPDPLDPFRWHLVLDFGAFYQLGQADTRSGALTMAQAIHPKPERTPALLAAEASPLGRAYMDWSPMPFLSESRPGDPTRAADAEAGPDPASLQHTIVTFRDPRFMVDLPLLRSRTGPPLSGTVELDQQGRVVRQVMDGRIQH